MFYIGVPTDCHIEQNIYVDISKTSTFLMKRLQRACATRRSAAAAIIYYVVLNRRFLVVCAIYVDLKAMFLISRYLHLKDFYIGFLPNSKYILYLIVSR